VRQFVGVVVLAAVVFSALGARAQSDSGVGIVVLKEHGVGSPALAQPYLDRFVAMAAEENDWVSASGRYFTSRPAAEAFIQAQKPHYGIFSLAAFLALKEKYHFEVIGQVAVSLVGGRQYALISKTATSLAECKGNPLASDHVDDPRFIERVVAAGQFKLADFKLEPTQRPLQTIKKVLSDEVLCALVDDAQVAELSHIEGADGVRTVWKSAELPPMAVVAFPSAPTAERKKFQDKLDDVCDHNEHGVCGEVGIVSLHLASAADYGAVLMAYGK